MMRDSEMLETPLQRAEDNQSYRIFFEPRGGARGDGGGFDLGFAVRTGIAFSPGESRLLTPAADPLESQTRADS